MTVETVVCLVNGIYISADQEVASVTSATLDDTNPADPNFGLPDRSISLEKAYGVLRLASPIARKQLFTAAGMSNNFRLDIRPSSAESVVVTVDGESAAASLVGDDEVLVSGEILAEGAEVVVNFDSIEFKGQHRRTGEAGLCDGDVISLTYTPFTGYAVDLDYITAPGSSGNTWCVRPSGSDLKDASNIQYCMEQSKLRSIPALIELAAGTYYIRRQISCANFVGTIRGAGMDGDNYRTILMLNRSDEGPMALNYRGDNTSDSRLTVHGTVSLGCPSTPVGLFLYEGKDSNTAVNCTIQDVKFLARHDSQVYDISDFSPTGGPARLFMNNPTTNVGCTILVSGKQKRHADISMLPHDGKIKVTTPKLTLNNVCIYQLDDCAASGRGVMITDAFSHSMQIDPVKLETLNPRLSAFHMGDNGLVHRATGLKLMCLGGLVEYTPFGGARPLDASLFHVQAGMFSNNGEPGSISPITPDLEVNGGLLNGWSAGCLTCATWSSFRTTSTTRHYEMTPGAKARLVFNAVTLGTANPLNDDEHWMRHAYGADQFYALNGAELSMRQCTHGSGFAPWLSMLPQSQTNWFGWGGVVERINGQLVLTDGRDFAIQSDIAIVNNNFTILADWGALQHLIISDVLWEGDPAEPIPSALANFVIANNTYRTVMSDGVPYPNTHFECTPVDFQNSYIQGVNSVDIIRNKYVALALPTIWNFGAVFTFIDNEVIPCCSMEAPAQTVVAYLLEGSEATVDLANLSDKDHGYIVVDVSGKRNVVKGARKSVDLTRIPEERPDQRVNRLKLAR